MNTTTNLELLLPDYTDDADVSLLNYNSVKLDGIVATKDDINEVKGNIGDLDNAIDSLQATILTKMTTPAGGSVGLFLTVDENGDPIWGQAASPSTVAAAAEAWLEEHVDPGQTLAIDAQLELQGYAADAQVTGNTLTRVASGIAPLYASAAENDPESYVMYDREFYFLESGHAPSATWAETTKRKTTVGEEIVSLRDNMISVGASAPTNYNNRMWVKPQEDEEVLVPTYTEFKHLEEKVGKVLESDEEDSDFDVSDYSGNVIVRVADGHVQTKKFNSAYAMTRKESNKSGVDLDIADTNGHVIMRLKDGGIQTKEFNSADLKKPLEAYSASILYNSGSTNTITINHAFKKGDEIYFHLDDGNGYNAYGRYAIYYEGSTALTSNRRGSNGYYRHVITADCNSVGISIVAGEYSNNTNLTLWVYKLNEEVKQKIVTVKSDGTGMFQTIKAAVESITDANHLTNPYVIEVYPGTYDTLDGYTDAQIGAEGFVGVMLTDGISIRGVGRRDDIILTAELNTSSWSSTIRGNVSTLNIQGEGNIENLTIIGKNIRYCVHDDFISPTNSHDKRIVRNCKFGGEYLSYYPHFTTYGAGMGVPRDYLIENCDFGYDLGIHSNGGYSFGCTIEVNNCSGCRFRIGDNASAEANAVNRVIVNNCNFQVIRTNHTDPTLSNHMILEGVGCENSMIRDVNGNLYRLGMISLAPVGLVTKTLVKRDTSGLGFVATHDLSTAYGVVIGSDSDYSYVQWTGYISSVILGISGLSVGDYVTVDTSTNLIVSGGTAANAVGVVMAVDTDSIAYIRLLI